MTMHQTWRQTRRFVIAVLCTVAAACGGGGGGNGDGGGGTGGTGGGGTGGGGTPPSTPPTVSALSLNPMTVTGGAGAQGTVTLSPAPTAGTSVALSADNGAANVPGSITVNSGATTGNFDVSTSAVSTVTPVTIRATLNSTTASAVLTLNPPVLAAVVRVVSLSQARRKQGNSVVDIPGKPAGSLNTCPIVQDGGGQRLDCEIDASGSTSPNGFSRFRYKWRLANVDGDSGNTTANRYRPTVQNCGFFGGQNDNGNQFLNMRVTVEVAGNSGTSVTGVVEGVSVFPAGQCGYAF